MGNFLGILFGLVFGVANIIPGVSGGTMLITCGCYDKVCGALALDLKEIKRNLKFLIFFGIGAVLGIVGFSNLITMLFDSFPTETYMFFIGLIVGSIPLIIRNATVKEKFKPLCLVPFVLALALVIGLTVLEKISEDPAPMTVSGSNPYTVTFANNSDKKITDWSVKIENGIGIGDCSENVEFAGKETSAAIADTIRPLGSGEIMPHESVTFTFKATDMPELKLRYSYEINAGFVLTVIGASFLAAMAMIIPGVSGSFIMVLLGTYATVISAIKDFNFGVLIPTLIGVALGLVLGARLIRLLLKKHRLIVFSAILGLCAGSIFAILPEGFGLNLHTAIGAAALAAGFALSFTIGKHTKVETE
ncbi:MAG: DUF368 domain-containing protein [Firmicutes bacterium]|nr:DUF368 domain-containing protein [[Eubacterium] siraeum]MCM1488386.1 DUF368 domain-containing protein [Bacillota bacterium]